MKKIYKLLAGVVTCLFLMFTITACEDCPECEKCEECKTPETQTPPTQSPCTGGELTLEEVNELLNGADMDHANAVAIVPFNHVNGPREEWDFYALINFVYRDRAEGYVKYQVTYLSCTCRTSDVNYWQTAYIELSLPESGDAEEAVLRKLSFDQDGTGHYTAGFWGDSSPITSGNKVIATYDRVDNGEGGYYPSIKYDYIPLLEGKTKAEIDQWDFVDDMKEDGVMNQDTFDDFTGASVSTNNILRILHSVFQYHADTYF